MKFLVNDENPIKHVCRVLVLGTPRGTLLAN
jgi:hypothetical protein